MRYFIEDLGKYVNETVELKGWAYNTRSSGKIKFLELRDGTGMVQCIFYRGECDEAAFENFGEITQETALKVTGVVREHPKKPGVFEIGAESFEIIGASPDFPISPKEHGTDFLMNHRHLWPRSKRQHATPSVFGPKSLNPSETF
ncbi:MAG: OB-fold nucleic acid binding domain-containing protein [Bdellovibrionales bacterium]